MSNSYKEGSNRLGPQGSDPPLAVTITDLIQAEIDSGRIQLFQSYPLGGHVNVRVPNFAIGDYRIDDADFKDWLSHFAFENTRRMLEPSGLQSICRILRAKASTSPERDPQDREIEQLFETDNVFSTIYRYASESSTLDWRGSMTEFYQKLKNYRATHAQPGRAVQTFPHSASSLSRRLPNLLPALKSIGILLQYYRSNGSKVTISKITDAQITDASSNSSAVTPASTQDLEASDDMDDMIKFVESETRRIVPTSNQEKT